MCCFYVDDYSVLNVRYKLILFDLTLTHSKPKFEYLHEYNRGYLFKDASCGQWRFQQMSKSDIYFIFK